jgi:hypothetical protein
LRMNPVPACEIGRGIRKTGRCGVVAVVGLEQQSAGWVVGWQRGIALKGYIAWVIVVCEIGNRIAGYVYADVSAPSP